MRAFVGTSGFSYAAWKGSFYPKELKEPMMLGYYAARFPTVEINNTFYRMPNAATLGRWAGETPAAFSFVLKAPRQITHMKRLGDAGSLQYFLETATALGPKLGPVLFQLPPFFKKDAERLRSFLALLPAGFRAAFEFRHASWFDDEVRGLLKERGAALCLADTDEAEPPELTPTAAWGYLRLRRAEYDDAALERWAAAVQQQGWSDVYVFFKHEDAGKGPALAARLLALLA